jgi:hypothetical protein
LFYLQDEVAARVLRATRFVFEAEVKAGLRQPGTENEVGLLAKCREYKAYSDIVHLERLMHIRDQAVPLLLALQNAYNTLTSVAEWETGRELDSDGYWNEGNSGYQTLARIEQVLDQIELSAYEVNQVLNIEALKAAKRHPEEVLEEEISWEEPIPRNEPSEVEPASIKVAASS